MNAEAVKIDNNELSDLLAQLNLTEEDFEAAQKEIKAEPVKVKEDSPIKEVAVDGKPQTLTKRGREKLPVMKNERVIKTIGDKIDGVVLLEKPDLAKSDEEKKRCKEFILDRLKNAPKKVANRMTFFMEYVAGKSGILNNVLATAVRLLVKHGEISASSSVKERGNLYQALIDYPYSPKSAAAMGMNTVKAMQVLKIVVPNDYGRLVANPDSIYLEKLKEKMGL